MTLYNLKIFIGNDQVKTLVSPHFGMPVPCIPDEGVCEILDLMLAYSKGSGPAVFRDKSKCCNNIFPPEGIEFTWNKDNLTNLGKNK